MNKTILIILSIILACNARFHTFNQHHQKQSNDLELLTKSIWKHHIDAWDAKDVDEILIDYDEDSYLIVNNKIYKGLNRIRRVFEQLYPLFAQGNNNIDTATILGETVYISWHFKPSLYPLHTHHGTDSFFIVNGKIRSQTIFSTLYDFVNIE